MGLPAKGPDPSTPTPTSDRLPAAAWRERDHLLSLAFNSARDMMLLASVEPGPLFRVLSVNRQYVEVVRGAGYPVTEEDFIGRTFDEVREIFQFSKEAWAPIMARYYEAVQTKRVLNYEELTETPKGLFYGDTSITPVCDETGRCILVLYASADITARKRAELALKDSEEKFSKAFRASPGAMAISDPGGHGFIEVNDGYVRMFGYAREELIGHQMSELNLWSSVEQRTQFLEVFKRQGFVRNMEVVRRRRDGTLLTCLLNSEALELGGRRCILSSLYDISSRLRAEQALRDSEQKFSKAFRATPDAVFITELETGRIVDVNEGVRLIYGWTREECVGHTTLELGLLADPADRDRVIARLRANGGTLRGLELLGRARSGATVDVLVSCEIIELEGRAHLVTIAHDITARKAGERALRESEAKFSQAFRASPGAMGISDMATRNFVEVNDGYCRMFGFTREELIGHSALELGLWADPAERKGFVDELEANGAVRELEFLGRRKDGAVINCMLRAETVELGGRIHVVTALHDFTARKRAEEARVALEAQLRQAQKLEALGQLAGGIAHDFNNILTGIIAYTELALIDAEWPAELRKHLATVRKASDRASDLVRQILTFSRKQAHEHKPVTLALVVREALKLLRSSLPKTIEFVEQIDSATPVVRAEPTQLHQVVMNLCTNAAHAMRTRPGRLTVTLGPWVVGEGAHREPAGLAPGRYARLAVADTGHGMDAETMARVFDPFFTTKAPGEGTGLGLAVVHGIIEDHEGLITLRSTIDVGTTFEVYLPEYTAGDLSEAAATAALPRGQGQRVLLIDDEWMVAGGAGEMLQRFGYKVTTHTDPRAAWQAFDAAPNAFDLVITDLTMPHLDGVAMVRRLQLRRPGVPVLLTTGHSGAWTTESVRALGARALLLKPLTASKLARAVADVFNHPA